LLTARVRDRCEFAACITYLRLRKQSAPADGSHVDRADQAPQSWRQRPSLLFELPSDTRSISSLRIAAPSRAKTRPDSAPICAVTNAACKSASSSSAFISPLATFCRLEGGERTFVTAKPGDGRATPTFREAQDICEGGSRFAPFQCTGRAALARSSNSFSWRRKKKIPAAAMPIATTSKSKLIGPATSLIFSPNR
jgi:hypothetical protein